MQKLTKASSRQELQEVSRSVFCLWNLCSEQFLVPSTAFQYLHQVPWLLVVLGMGGKQYSAMGVVEGLRQSKNKIKILLPLAERTNLQARPGRLLFICPMTYSHLLAFLKLQLKWRSSFHQTLRIDMHYVGRASCRIDRHFLAITHTSTGKVGGCKSCMALCIYCLIW